MEDVSLRQSVSHIKFYSRDILNYNFSVITVYNQLKYNNEMARNVEPSQPLIYSGVVKRLTTENVGLNFKHLHKIMTGMEKMDF